jgi:hypothetical protein
VIFAASRSRIMAKDVTAMLQDPADKECLAGASSD